MKYTKENYEYLLSLIDEFNLYSYKALALKYNELTGSKESEETLRGMMNHFGFSMRKYRINKVLELRKIGLTNQQIADIVGLNKEAVSRIGCMFGSKKIKRRKPGFWKESKFRRKLIEEIEKNNYNLNKTGRRLGIKFSELVKILKYHDLYDMWKSKAQSRDGSKTRKCIEYYKQYPYASPYKICELVGCDYKVAWKAKKRFEKDSQRI